MKKVKSDTLKSLIFKLLLGAIVAVLCTLPITEIYFSYLETLRGLIVIGVCYLAYAIFKICRYLKFVRSIKVQEEKYHPVMDFEVLERNVADAVIMNQSWFLVPSKGIAICREAFQMASIRSKTVLEICDLDGHKYRFKAPKNSAANYNESLNTWSYSSKVEDEVIFTGHFSFQGLVADIVLAVILLAVSVFTFDYLKWDIEYLHDNYYNEKKAMQMLAEVKANSIYREEIFDFFSEDMYVISYNNTDIDVYRDGVNYEIVNNTDYLACGIVKFYDANDELVGQTTPTCIRPHYETKGTSDPNGVSHSFDEVYYFGNYYGGYWVDHRTYDYDETNMWINITKNNLTYYDVDSLARNLLAESIIVNEKSAIAYLYDDSKAINYRMDNGYSNYDTLSASYMVMIEVETKKVEIWKLESGVIVEITSIEVE